MKITGKLISNPTCRLDENNQFIAQIIIKPVSRFRFSCIYNLKGKVATFVYNNFKKWDLITVFINKNNIVYKIEKAD